MKASKWIWFAAAVLASIVWVMSLRFFTFEQRDILLDKPAEIYQTVWYRAGFYLHVGSGMLALLLGLPQFLPGLRRRFLRLHRISGYVYAGAILLGGLSGLLVAPFATGGWVSATGFTCLALVWLWTTGQSVRTALRNDLPAHRVWTLRSYGVTFSAVTLRLGLLWVAMGWVSFLTIYPILAWASWLLNLVIVEVYLRRTELPVRALPPLAMTKK